MCQDNGRARVIFGLLGLPNPWGPEPIHLKSGTFDYVHSPTPHAQYGGGWEYGWNLNANLLSSEVISLHPLYRQLMRGRSSKMGSHNLDAFCLVSSQRWSVLFSMFELSPIHHALNWQVFRPTLIPFYNLFQDNWRRHVTANDLSMFQSLVVTIVRPSSITTGCWWLPPQPPSITAHWPVPNYTAWWQRHMCVNNLPRVALGSAATGIWTRDLLIASPAP